MAYSNSYHTESGGSEVAFHGRIVEISHFPDFVSGYAKDKRKARLAVELAAPTTSPTYGRMTAV